MKGQEEIIGFMLVVIMVMVIGLGFLFFFSPKAAERQDLDIQNLLYAWLSTSLDNQDIRTMIVSCAGCNLDSARNVLDTAIKSSGLINSINGYSLNITGTTEYIYFTGNLTGNTRAASIPVNENMITLKFFIP